MVNIMGWLSDVHAQAVMHLAQLTIARYLLSTCLRTAQRDAVLMLHTSSFEQDGPDSVSKISSRPTTQNTQTRSHSSLR